MQTAESFGLGRSGLARRSGAHPTRPDGAESFGEVIEHWLELSYALNEINRSMGHTSLYPFVLAPMVIRKLAFIDHLILGANRSGRIVTIG